MKACHRPWMLIACVVILALLFLLPRFGVNVAAAGVLLPLLMIGCCLLPMLLIVLPRKDDGGRGCCGAGKPAPSPPTRDGTKHEKDRKAPGCH